MSQNLFSSESVTEGHPDKVSDRISDTILDAYLAADPNSKVACETLVTTGLCVVAGEIHTTKPVMIDVQRLVRGAIKDIGYNDGDLGFSAESCAVLNALHEQSQDIRQGVDLNPAEVGAGDQGMMFGYACNETPELMPMPISLSHRMARKLADLRHNGTLPWLRPDGKTQVTVAYKNGQVEKIHTVVVSTQHDEKISQDDLKVQIRKHILEAVLPANIVSKDMAVHINPTGRFVIGGPHGDTGLTGRKIIVDTYGGAAPHGGGAFSGKDPTKVDRSAAYAARYIAKNVVAAGLADRFMVQLAYAIGVAEPVGLFVDGFGTAKVDSDKLSKMIREIFPTKPYSIIKELDLRRPIYAKTAAYGHFGREDQEFPWEKTDKVAALKSAFNVR